MDACMAKRGEGLDEEGCKEAQRRGKHLEEEVEEECKTSGTLCTITTTDKEGPEEEEECIPAECHQELQSIEKALVKDTEHEDEKDVPECKDFDCKVDIECPAR